MRDDAIVNDSPDIWRDDEIELAFVEAWDFIPTTATLTSTPSTPMAASPTSAGQSGPFRPQRPVAGGWNVEVRIPASHLFGRNEPLIAGKTMDFDLGLHDDDEAATGTAT